MSKPSLTKEELQVFVKQFDLIKNLDASHFANDKIQKIIKNFTIYRINNDLDEKISDINLNIKNSKVIISDQIELLDQNNISILVFENTLIFIDQDDLDNLRLNDLDISILSFRDIYKDSFFKEENQQLESKFKIKQVDETFKRIWSIISWRITGYLIKKSYEKTKKNRALSQNQDSERITVNRDDFVVLRKLGSSSSSNVDLIFHFERCELMAMKTPIIINVDQPKLFYREKKNYSEISHPFLPKFYDTPNKEKYLVMEYINGQTLDHIDIKQLKEKDVVIIIFELIVIVIYLHSKHLIYRDLKPNNIMIDIFKNVVLIDFDRLIENNQDEEDHIHDLWSDYVAPEIKGGRAVSEKSDIYSLGKVINYIIEKNKSNSTQNDYIKGISKDCTARDPEERLPVIDIFFIFIMGFYPVIKNESDIFEQILNMYGNSDWYIYYSFVQMNYPEAQNNLGVIYYEGQYISRDINKAIHYLTLAANQNHLEAQNTLGFIYYEGQYISRDINKAIHYLTLAANQNHPQAQYNLGGIYHEGQYISRDINKAIHYLTLAANQNFPEAQNILGVIYYKGQYISRDINKAIHYLTLAANQNFPEAQNTLSVIYYEGQYISRDINKAIHYLTLAANQNHPQAQYILGFIYHEGQYISRDINKAIHYLTLAANQNHPQAQNNLGFIYHEGQYISRDINKAIHYLTLAANQNLPEAQYNLGGIYYKGQYISRDINKAIHYLTLAANQNFPEAQNILGVIYYEGQYISRDINKAIHYLTLAANQNHLEAQNILGVIYYEGQYISRDINKAIHYLTLAANQNHPTAQYNFGFIYYEGQYISRDINKAIHYFTLAANQNHPEAQYILGIVYFKGQYIQRNIKKGFYYFQLASKYRFHEAHFVVGYFYHSGIYIKKNIEKAIHYYKEGSNNTDPYAKNNLAIIYKDGYGDEIKSRKLNPIEFLNEAIHQKKDILSMYNLANIYMYNDKSKIDDAIDLLFNSFSQFSYSLNLLCLALVKKYGFNFNKIEDKVKELDKNCPKNKLSLIINKLYYLRLYNNWEFESLYESYREKYFLYNYKHEIISFSDFHTKKDNDNQNKAPNINEIFYEGFGIEI